MSDEDGWRGRLPAALTFGVPVLAAAITVAVRVADDRWAGDAVTEATGGAVLVVNAAVAVLCGAAGGFLRRDEFAIRVLYLFPFGIIGLVVHAAAAALFAGLAVAAFRG